MTTIVEATIPADEFALESAFNRFGGVEFRMVRLVAHGRTELVPFLWADCACSDRLCETLETDQSIDSFELLAEFDGDCLLHLNWGPHVRLLASVLDAGNAAILDATGYDGVWYLQLFFPDHDGVSTTYDQCEEYGIDIGFERINHLSERSRYGYFGLTDRQYETLLTAYESGYYDVPRRVNQDELAQRFGVSHQAISERLRRAHETIVTNGLYHKIQPRDQFASPSRRHEADT
ncbi:helix-turn-helix domain-containing protein [Haloarcula marina]|uniref:helix-turn-helix domain-containing protein n=1 Tax=Haloarcula marina TaxID=2961574 RepID=UPI0020B88A83|nr:helix-turn-helix domain-containing protein [Halomicroarcula marina]